MVTETPNSKSINRLTALWALSESGLGGIMHALKIPFTGFIVGGFAVIIISLLAHFSNNNFKIILQSTLLVLLVKAGVSPQSPLAAYIAVVFQGIVGALFFSMISNYKIATILFGFIALIESAVQQLLLTTLLFGKSIWVAADLFVQDVLKDFHLSPDFSFSYWVILFYLIAYSFWGIYLGVYASKLPLKLQTKSVTVEERYRALKINPSPILSSEKKKRKGLIIVFSMLLFVVSIFLAEGYISKAIYVVLRTIALLCFVFFILKPVFLLLLKNVNDKKKIQIETIITQFPELGNLVNPAMQLAAEKKKGLPKYMEFVFVLIVLSLMNHSIIE